jgi:predicted esterase
MKRSTRLTWTIGMAISALGTVCGAQQPPPPVTPPGELPPPPPMIFRRQRGMQGQRQGIVTGGPSVTGEPQRAFCQINNDPKRSYVLLSPGGRGYYPRRFVRFADGTVHLQGSGKSTDPADKNATPATSSAGLLVVLPPEGAGGPTSAFWSDVMRSVLKGRYYVAVAVPPQWEGAQTVSWLTENTLKQVKEARFSTEAFTADIVRDVSAQYNIDPQRIFLHGAAESGLAAYACSLSETTPFRGFYIHDAPFRSTQLSSLARARGRRYFLQQSEDDKAEPLWMADAARKMLTDKGATVKLASYHGTGPYNFGENRWERMGEAINWLEAGVKPK